MTKTPAVFELSILIAACSSTPQSTPQETVILSEAITVQAGSGRVYEISKEQGEKDLLSLAKDADKEDIWIWTGKRWVDIGYDEEPFAVKNDIDSVLQIASSLPKSAPLYDYHIHPDDSNSYNPPSLQDFVSHTYLKKRLQEIGVPLISRVVDNHGVREFGLRDDDDQEYGKCYLPIGLDNMLQKLDLSRKEGRDSYIAELEKCGILLKYYPIE